MDRSLHKIRASDGQALLLAVLIMIAILLVGSLFVAVVNYNQRTSGRHTQLLNAMSLAEAGMAHANEMLQFSPQGLDWRPSVPSVPPVPPVEYDDGTVSPGFWGVDGVQYTDDDYYSTNELDQSWSGLMSVGPDGTAGNADDYYIRRG
ncbi:MAG: hypothetical protein KAW89_02900, partial [Armatimonadetes bacterium]|nr:hypothetical protein [Armatimonadota bacterium]